MDQDLTPRLRGVSCLSKSGRPGRPARVTPPRLPLATRPAPNTAASRRRPSGRWSRPGAPAGGPRRSRPGSPETPVVARPLVRAKGTAAGPHSVVSGRAPSRWIGFLRLPAAPCGAVPMSNEFDRPPRGAPSSLSLGPARGLNWPAARRSRPFPPSTPGIPRRDPGPRDMTDNPPDPASPRR